MRILVTGAAGYVGSLLVERLATCPEVTAIVATDRRARPLAESDGRVRYLVGALDDPALLPRLEAHLPLDAVVHAAFHIRAGYGRAAATVERANLDSCRNVFEFCFRNDVGRLLYFSSAAVYGARPENTPHRRFTEEDPLREETYPYGVQKRKSEELLRDLFRRMRPKTRVAVLRPCSITGPRFFAEPTKRITLLAFLKSLLPLIPKVSEQWARQYLHEDDLVRAVTLLLRHEDLAPYEVFNLAPADYLTARDIAAALGKRVLPVPAPLAGAAFALLWHGTRGRIPTAPGALNFYRYPVNLDGSKLARLGFTYRYTSSACLRSVRR